MAKRSKEKKRSQARAQSARHSAAGLNRTHLQLALQIGVIVAVVWWIYWPVLHGGWLMDDNLYLAGNPLMRDPDRLWKAWFEPGSFLEYYPIEESIQWMQWQLWHQDTVGYHVTNVILHLVSALLFWRLLGKLGLRLAWLGGLIFAVHPTTVESVAWIAEFKNTLSLPPFLLAMITWVDYEKRGRRRDYLLALGWFLVAMLCKPTMMMFPPVILLYTWWKRNRITWKDVQASAPFWVISLVLGLTVYLIGEAYGRLRPPVHDPVAEGGFFARLACAGLAISFYFWNCLWPVGLLPIYPKWRVDPPALVQFLPWVVLGAMLCWFWSRRESWGRTALLGFGFFLLNLAPALGLVLIPSISFTWVMDHFLYIPILGLIGLTVAGLDRFDRQMPQSVQRLGIGIVAISLMLLAWESHVYAGKFINQEALWTYIIQCNPDAWPARNNLGNTLLDEGRVQDAIQQFREALKINPDYAATHTNLGYALVEAGQVPEGIEQYQQAWQLDPSSSLLQNNWGNALAQSGRPGEAIAHYEEALRLDPASAPTQTNLGAALLLTGNRSEAILHFQAALGIDPTYAQAHNDWGIALIQMGRVAEAIDQYQAALQLDPNNGNAKSNLARAEAAVVQGE